MAYLTTDFETKDFNCINPRVYATKHQLNDPDMPLSADPVTNTNEYIVEMENGIKQISVSDRKFELHSTGKMFPSQMMVIKDQS